MLKPMKKVNVDENKNAEICHCKFEMVSGSYRKFPPVNLCMEGIQGKQAMWLKGLEII